MITLLLIIIIIILLVINDKINQKGLAMSEKTRAELKEQIKIMNHNYQVIREMHEKGYQYSVGEIKRLQDELGRTRKALEIAVDALKYANKCIKGGCVNWETEIDKALDEIKTALEQKE